MDQPTTAEQHKTKVFISYSRVDGAFAEKLRSALIMRGFEAYLDKEDILPGEPWRARIDGLILAADAIVFVMSPSSIASEICSWEVGRALELIGMHDEDPTRDPKLSLPRSQNHRDSILSKREDRVLPAWYRALGSPRTGGVYDDHYRTPTIDSRALRRDYRLPNAALTQQPDRGTRA